MLFLVNLEDFGLHSVMNKKEQPAMTEVGMVKQQAMPKSGIVEQQAMPGGGMMDKQVARKVQTPMPRCLALTETVLNMLVLISEIVGPQYPKIDKEEAVVQHYS